MTKAEYQTYLLSKHWRDLRLRKLEECDYHCQINADHTESLNVHHNYYGRTGDEELSDLVVICEDCHKTIHDLLAGIAFEKADDGALELYRKIYRQPIEWTQLDEDTLSTDMLDVYREINNALFHCKQEGQKPTTERIKKWLPEYIVEKYEKYLKLV